jgi:Protein of unknown function (DUF3592)
MPDSPGTNDGCTKLFSWGFLLVWCGGIFSADGVFLWSAARQALTLDYAETTGTITSSQIQGKKSRYLTVTYDYVVDGKEMKGTRFRTNIVGSNTGTAERHAAAFPVGKEVPVYFNPADPTDAVLVKGPTGSDLFALWFLLPFNVVAFTGLVAVLRRKRTAFDPDDPRVVERTDSGWRLRPRARHRWIYFAAGLFVLGFGGVFAIGFPTRFDPPLEFMLATWIVGPSLVWFFSGRLSKRVALGWIEREQTLVLPRNGIVVPREEVHGFAVEWDTDIFRQKNETLTYFVALRHGSNRTTVRFTSWSDRNAAHAAANWLTASIGIGFRQP